MPTSSETMSFVGLAFLGVCFLIMSSLLSTDMCENLPNDYGIDHVKSSP